MQGGIGIDIEADHVSIANGRVGEIDGGFAYGVVGEGNYISAANLNITTDVGMVLNDVSYSAFTNIVYVGADTQYHSENGRVLSTAVATIHSHPLTLRRSALKVSESRIPAIISSKEPTYSAPRRGKLDQGSC